MTGKRSHRRNKLGSLTPRQLKIHRRYDVDCNDDKNVTDESFREKEDVRKEKRNQAQDQNRPNFDNSSSPEYEVLTLDDDDDGQWMEEEDDLKPVSKKSNKHDKSLENVKNIEEWQLNRQKARRSNFAKNRQRMSGSLRKKVAEKTSISYDDWAKFQSCISLKSGDPNSSNEALHTPKKGCTRNFLMLHHNPVNRMSDVYVKPSQRLKVEDKSNAEDSIRWKDVSFFVIGFCFAVVSIMTMYKEKD